MFSLFFYIQSETKERKKHDKKYIYLNAIVEYFLDRRID